MDDYVSRLAQLLSGPPPASEPPIFPRDMVSRLMNQTIVPRQPGNEETVRALLGDRSTMNLVTPLAQDNSMAPSIGLAAQLLGPGRGPMRAPMFAAETGGASTPRPNYTQMLDEALHKDAGAGFPAVFEQLKGLSAAELKTIAKEWNGVNVSSATEALKKIWARHMNMEVIRAKQRYTGSAG